MGEGSLGFSMRSTAGWRGVVPVWVPIAPAIVAGKVVERIGLGRCLPTDA